MSEISAVIQSVSLENTRVPVSNVRRQRRLHVVLQCHILFAFPIWRPSPPRACSAKATERSPSCCTTARLVLLSTPPKDLSAQEEATDQIFDDFPQLVRRFPRPQLPTQRLPTASKTCLLDSDTTNLRRSRVNKFVGGIDISLTDGLSHLTRCICLPSFEREANYFRFVDA